MNATRKSWQYGLLSRKLRPIKSYWYRVTTGAIKDSWVYTGMRLLVLVEREEKIAGGSAGF